MKKIIALSIAALAILASCKKENQNAPLTLEEQLGFEIKSTFEATIVNDAADVNAPKDGKGTMAHLDGENYVCWNDTDKISINGITHQTTIAAIDQTNMTVNFYGSVEVPLGTDNKYHAFFPAGIQSTTEYNKGTLPAYQTFSYEGAISLPMYAVATAPSHALAFHNLCSILEITIPAGIEANKIEITADECLAGSFEIDANGVLNMTETADSYKKLTINAGSTPWRSGNTIKCAIPGRTQDASNADATANFYHNMKITIFKTDGSTMVRSKAQFKVKPSQIYKMTIGLKAKAADAFVKAGSNMAAFSVSATQQVYFTSGNLVSVNDGNTYISPCQTDYPNVYEAGHVAHYYWYTTLADAAKEGRGGAGSSSTLFCCASGYQVKDFNGNTIQSGNLRLLSNTEWAYLLGVKIYSGNNHSTMCEYDGEQTANQRTNAATLRAYAYVEGTKCLVVAPDGGTDPTANGNYTLAQIASLGYLCLPLGGYRVGSAITTQIAPQSTTTYDFGARYWTSTNAGDGSNSYSIVVRDNQQNATENQKFWISREPQQTARLIRLAINTGDYQ